MLAPKGYKRFASYITGGDFLDTNPTNNILILFLPSIQSLAWILSALIDIQVGLPQLHG